MRKRGEQQPLDGLTPEHRARIETLLAKGWSPPGEHPLSRLHGACLDDHRLIALIGPKNNVGSRYFKLFLADGAGRLCDDLLALGLHNRGPFPAFNWIEMTQYRELMRIGGETLDLATTQLDRVLFGLLALFVPPGGHIMVEYDSPTHRASERMLTLGLPPVCSPIGYLMFGIGCRSFRDWYISEGGREGPRKLQGFMPLNDQISREKTGRLRDQLEEFLSRSRAQNHGHWGVLARRNAQALLQALSVA